MRILAIESSAMAGGVAALADGEPLYEVSLAAGQRSARGLAPAISELLKQVAWRPRDVELVAVTVGPGSFTGLRVGVTTAKLFAYAVGAGVLGVNTLEAIALRAGLPRGQKLHVILDAQRYELYAAEFVIGDDGWPLPSGETRIVDQETWLSALPPDATVTGPAAAAIQPRLPTGVIVVAPHLAEPTATSIGQIAHHRHAIGERHDLWRLIPQYYRRSAAEEKLAGKE